MIRFRTTIAAVALVWMTAWMPCDAVAQRIYSGNTPADIQYPRSGGIDSIGRAVDVDARSIDRYGHYLDDFGQRSNSYGVPGHYHGNGYSAGGYYPGGYSGLGYSSSIGYSVGLGGYSGGYYSNSGRFRPGIGVGTTIITPPRSIVVGGVYPSRTVLNNATRGGVVEYTHNGNGYIYSPGTSFQTVISSGPSIFPAMSVVQPSQPPVIIETQPTNNNSTPSESNSSVIRQIGNVAEIKLIYPKSAAASLSYVLNGTVYAIKPGYSQVFAEDRVWTIEFLRGGNRSQIRRYQLKAGTYTFEADENGWDLKQIQTATAAELPPPPPAPVPSPDL